MDLKQFFNPQYWLGGISETSSVPYDALSIENQLFWVFINTALFFSILGFGLIIWNQFLKRPYQKKFIALVSSNCVTIGLLLLLWFTCRTTNISFVGSRLFLLGILIYFVVITAYLARYYLVFYKVEEAYARRMAQRTY